MLFITHHGAHCFFFLLKHSLHNARQHTACKVGCSHRGPLLPYDHLLSGLRLRIEFSLLSSTNLILLHGVAQGVGPLI